DPPHHMGLHSLNFVLRFVHSFWFAPKHKTASAVTDGGFFNLTIDSICYVNPPLKSLLIQFLKRPVFLAEFLLFPTSIR
ncbi:hypothetical protein, partial [Acinetobacter baumannii]|uniref:hypothetical protein n=1 Tax=Acinetobacter baumannii TaxID=470 RepID=UPI001C5BCE8A